MYLGYCAPVYGAFFFKILYWKNDVVISKIVHENTSIFVRYLSVKGTKTTDKIEKVTKRQLFKNGITEPFTASCEIFQIAKFRFRNEQAAGSSPITSSKKVMKHLLHDFLYYIKNQITQCCPLSRYSLRRDSSFFISIRPISYTSRSFSGLCSVLPISKGAAGRITKISPRFSFSRI